MVQSLDVRVLWSSPDLQVLGTTWDRERHPAEAERQADWAVIEWMRKGCFRKAVGSRTVVGDTNHATFFNPGEVFRVSHPVGRTNAGTSLRLSVQSLAAILSDLDPAAADDAARPFRLPQTATSSACHLAQQYLMSYLTHAEVVEALVVEEAAIWLARSVLELGYRDRPHSSPVATPTANRRVVAMQEFLARSYADNVRLGDIADAAECSPWHAAHLFSSCTGISLHRYLRRIRLREAMTRVLDGCMDLSRAALDAGFASHSHLTASFHREFGVTPSGLRATTARDFLARLSSRHNLPNR